MRDNWINNVEVKGYVFSHSLQKRIAGPNSKNPGQEFIMGDLNVATDADAMNVVPVRFTYVTPKYRNGNDNATYQNLAQIIDSGKTYEAAGAGATKVRINGDVEVNDFLGRDGNMVEAKRVRGSFCHFATMPTDTPDTFCAKFETDMLIAATIEQEPENQDPYVQLRGYVFNFRGDLIPVTYSISNKAGMDYFIGQDISNDNPLLTKVWGNIISTTVKIEHETESAFGEAKVDITTRTVRAWEVSGAANEPYEFDDEATITRKELKQKVAERKEKVAAEKVRSEEYRASQNNQNSAFSSPANQASETVIKTETKSVDDFEF